MPSSSLILCRPFSSCPQSFPASGSFQMSQLLPLCSSLNPPPPDLRCPCNCSGRIGWDGGQKWWKGKENPAAVQTLETVFQNKDANIHTNLLNALNILLSSLSLFFLFLLSMFSLQKGGSELERGRQRHGNGDESRVTDWLGHHGKRKELEKRAG